MFDNSKHTQITMPNTTTVQSPWEKILLHNLLIPSLVEMISPKKIKHMNSP